MLEPVADFVSSFPEVNHNYQREHRLNLWFVVAATSRERVWQVLTRDRVPDLAAGHRPAAGRGVPA